MQFDVAPNWTPFEVAYISGHFVDGFIWLHLVEFWWNLYMVMWCMEYEYSVSFIIFIINPCVSLVMGL